MYLRTLPPVTRPRAVPVSTNGPVVLARAHRNISYGGPLSQLRRSRAARHVTRSTVHAESSQLDLGPEALVHTKSWRPSLFRRSRASPEAVVPAHDGSERPTGADLPASHLLDQQQQQHTVVPSTNAWMQQHLQVMGFLGRTGLVATAGLGAFTLVRWFVTTRPDLAVAAAQAGQKLKSQMPTWTSSSSSMPRASSTTSSSSQAAKASTPTSGQAPAPTAAANGFKAAATAPAAPPVASTASSLAASTSTVDSSSWSEHSVPASSTAPGSHSPFAQREPGWWRGLRSIYYLNFGSYLGMLPRLKLKTAQPGSEDSAASSEASHLMAFESRADADFVARTIREHILSEPGPLSAQGLDEEAIQQLAKGRVIPAKPSFLEDCAEGLGLKVEVLAEGRLQHNAQLNPRELHLLLAHLVQPVIGGMEELLSSGTAAAPTTTSGVEASSSTSAMTSSSSSTGSNRVQGFAAGVTDMVQPQGFVPVSTSFGGWGEGPLLDAPSFGERGILPLSLADIPIFAEFTTTTSNSSSSSNGQQPSKANLEQQRPQDRGAGEQQALQQQLQELQEQLRVAQEQLQAQQQQQRQQQQQGGWEKLRAEQQGQRVMKQEQQQDMGQQQQQQQQQAGQLPIDEVQQHSPEHQLAPAGAGAAAAAAVPAAGGGPGSLEAEDRAQEADGKVDYLAEYYSMQQQWLAEQQEKNRERYGEMVRTSTAAAVAAEGEDDSAGGSTDGYADSGTPAGDAAVAGAGGDSWREATSSRGKSGDLGPSPSSSSSSGAPQRGSSSRGPGRAAEAAAGVMAMAGGRARSGSGEESDDWLLADALATKFFSGEAAAAAGDGDGDGPGRQRGQSSTSTTSSRARTAARVERTPAPPAEAPAAAAPGAAAAGLEGPGAGTGAASKLEVQAQLLEQGFEELLVGTAERAAAAAGDQGGRKGDRQGLRDSLWGSAAAVPSSSFGALPQEALAEEVKGATSASASPSSSSSSTGSISEALAGPQRLADMQQQLAELQQQLAALGGDDGDALLTTDGRIDRGAGLQLIQKVQGLVDGLKQVQSNMEQTAAAAGVKLQPPPGPRLVDRVKAALDRDSDLIEAKAAAAGGEVVDVVAVPVVEGQVVGPKGLNPERTGEGVEPKAAGGWHPQQHAEVTTTSSSNGSGFDGGSSSNGNSSSSGMRAGRPPGAKRTWGAWGSNVRIERANVGLLKKGGGTAKPSSGAATAGSSSSSSSQISGALPAAPSSSSSSRGQVTKEEEEGPRRTVDGAVILNKSVGSKRPKKVDRDPGERVDTLKQAFRLAAGQMQGTAGRSGEEEEEEGLRLMQEQLRGSQEAENQEQWWQRRFQAVFLPNISTSPGAVAFLQMDVSLNPDVKDVRVVAFEDRHDCMHCLTVLSQWPELSSAQLSVGAMPTHSIEAEIQRSYLDQESGAAARASRPAGVVVFRRGKLPLRVGMSQEEFTQVVVYQAAAQITLGQVGYRFDDF